MTQRNKTILSYFILFFIFIGGIHVLSPSLFGEVASAIYEAVKTGFQIILFLVLMVVVIKVMVSR